SRVDPTLLNDFEMATNGNSDPPVPDLQTMEELCQPTLNGRGGTFRKRRLEECYDLIENMTAHHNDWDTFIQRTTVGQTQNLYPARAYNQGGNSYQPQVHWDNSRTIRDGINQSSFKEFNDLLFDNIMDFGIYSSLMLDCWFKVFFHKNFNRYKSTLLLHTQIFTMMIGNLLSPSKNEYSRWGGRIDDDIPLTIKDDNLREKLSNVHLLIANIEALKDNPTSSFESLTKFSSTSLNSFLEETNTFHNSLPEFENFYFDLGKISSGSTTTHSDISLPDYEAFYFDDDHVKEISSGSTTTHSDISLSEYDSLIFDLTQEEFVDELANIISPPEYDRFYFRDLPNQGELMYVLNSRIRENCSTTLVNLPIEDDYSLLLAYVV
nr:reverse transcriptase domain-containing protein [Tanacetum cinerariifolium]